MGIFKASANWLKRKLNIKEIIMDKYLAKNENSVISTSDISEIRLSSKKSDSSVESSTASAHDPVSPSRGPELTRIEAFAEHFLPSSEATRSYASVDEISSASEEKPYRNDNRNNNSNSNTSASASAEGPSSSLAGSFAGASETLADIPIVPMFPVVQLRPISPELMEIIENPGPSIFCSSSVPRSLFIQLHNEHLERQESFQRQLNTQNEHIMDQDREIAALRGTVEAQDIEIIDLRDTVESQHREIIELRNTVEMQDREILQLRNTVAELQATVAELQATVARLLANQAN